MFSFQRAVGWELFAAWFVFAMAKQNLTVDKKFNSVLKEYIDFLSASDAPGAPHWSKMLADAANGANVVLVAKKVLSFYGGMGSINDIVFRFGSDEAKRYERLNEKLYTLAKEIIRSNPTNKWARKRS